MSQHMAWFDGCGVRGRRTESPTERLTWNVWLDIMEHKHCEYCKMQLSVMKVGLHHALLASACLSRRPTTSYPRHLHTPKLARTVEFEAHQDNSSRILIHRNFAPGTTRKCFQRQKAFAFMLSLRVAPGP
jgi:hypothetical protein